MSEQGRGAFSRLTQRTVQRYVHIALSVVLGTFLYSPLQSSESMLLLVQAVVFPALALSGLLMWRGWQLRAWLRGQTDTTSG